jgi:hypothetical protein
MGYKFFQYGASVDVYSLTIIIYELFSGINPFPGHISNVFEAKRLDVRPVVPSDFPSYLKELVIQGWSQDPKNRPPIAKFMSVMNQMLYRGGTQSNQSSALPEIANLPNEKHDQSSSFLDRNSKEIENISKETTKQLNQTLPETNSSKEKEEDIDSTKKNREDSKPGDPY